MRSIDADELKELLKEYQAECLKNPSEIMGVLYGGLGAILDVIDQQPTIDSVKHGKWIDDGDCFICSNCRKAFGFLSVKCVTNFCPNCGAKMGGDGE